MNGTHPLSRLARAYLVWFKTEALPLWALRGVDPAGGFYEALDFSGAPVAHLARRLVVQCRQIHVFAEAEKRGWLPGGGALALDGLRHVAERYLSPDGAEGLVFSLHPDGSVADFNRDCYAHAFVLLALASVDAGARSPLLEDTLSFLDTRLRSPHGGYLEAWPGIKTPRRQNPHMHLLEAFLALASATGTARFLDAASAMVGLCRTRFYDRESGALREFFADDWSRLPGPEGDAVEPGHHYEWVFLLRHFEKMAGGGASEMAPRLLAHAMAHGHDHAGLVIDRVAPDGRVARGSLRIWPQTEALRVLVSDAAGGDGAAADRAAAILTGLKERFFLGAVPGAFIDQIDAAGHPVSQMMPASTLYHLLGAAIVIEEYLDRL